MEDEIEIDNVMIDSESLNGIFTSKKSKQFKISSFVLLFMYNNFSYVKIIVMPKLKFMKAMTLSLVVVQLKPSELAKLSRIMALENIGPK